MKNIIYESYPSDAWLRFQEHWIIFLLYPQSKSKTNYNLIRFLCLSDSLFQLHESPLFLPDDHHFIINFST